MARSLPEGMKASIILLLLAAFFYGWAYYAAWRVGTVIDYPAKFISGAGAYSPAFKARRDGTHEIVMFGGNPQSNFNACLSSFSGSECEKYRESLGWKIFEGDSVVAEGSFGEIKNKTVYTSGYTELKRGHKYRLYLIPMKHLEEFEKYSPITVSVTAPSIEQKLVGALQFLIALICGALGVIALVVSCLMLAFTSRRSS